MGPDPALSAPALVILAAGASTRLGQHKALVELHGEPAIAHLLRAGRALGEAAPLVITGAVAVGAEETVSSAVTTEQSESQQPGGTDHDGHSVS